MSTSTPCFFIYDLSSGANVGTCHQLSSLSGNNSVLHTGFHWLWRGQQAWMWRERNETDRQHNRGTMFLACSQTASATVLPNLRDYLAHHQPAEQSMLNNQSFWQNNIPAVKTIQLHQIKPLSTVAHTVRTVTGNLCSHMKTSGPAIIRSLTFYKNAMSCSERSCV